MSSNIRVARICQHCGVTFEAKTTVTKFCSDPCGKRAYKANLRKHKVERSQRETKIIKDKPLEDLKAKEFLTVRDVALLLNSSKQTVYNLINSGIIHAVNIKVKKTLIKRSEIDNLFNLPEVVPVAKMEPKVKQLNENECYSMSEIQTKFGVSDKALYNLIKRNNVPKFQRGKYVYASKKIIDELLAAKN